MSEIIETAPYIERLCNVLVFVEIDGRYVRPIGGWK